MNNKVCLIIPYFGIMPSYFDLWLESAGHNREFTFLIYTDSYNENQKKIYNNIIFHKITFDEFRSKIEKLFDFPIVLDTPYKLCDYKPTYGAALTKDLETFDFWGYCDVDLIFGKLSNFITDEILNKYDRVYNLGHFTLYRNIEEINNLYKVKHNFDDCFSYKYSYRTSFVTGYDEIGTKYGYGLSEICKRIGIKNYISCDFADILPDKYELELAHTTDNRVGYSGKRVDYFFYDHGRLFGVCGKEKKEYAYVHLQKRDMQGAVMNDNIYYISPTHFRNRYEDALIDGISQEKKNFFRKLKRSKVESKYKKLKQGAIIHLMNRLFRRINVR